MGAREAAKWGKGLVMFTLNELIFTFGGFYVCANFWWKSTKKCERESARRRGRRTEANWFYNLSHAIRYGTDNKDNNTRTINF